MAKSAEEKATEKLEKAREDASASAAEHARKVREAEDELSKVRGEPEAKRWPPDGLEYK